MKTTLLMVALAASFVAGCGKAKLATVTGAITVDGQPAEAGSIAFFPTSGKAPTAGSEIHAGRYTTAVTPGPAKVEIRVPKQVGQKKLYSPTSGPERPIFVELLPAKYNDATELQLEIQPGANEHNFTLTTH